MTPWHLFNCGMRVYCVVQMTGEVGKRQEGKEERMLDISYKWFSASVCLLREVRGYMKKGVSKKPWMENVYMYSLIHHSLCLGVSLQYVLYYIAQVIFCLSRLRTWSPLGHGPCLVTVAWTRRGLSLKVIKKWTCWLGEKPAIGFLRATFFSCADCIQRSV